MNGYVAEEAVTSLEFQHTVWTFGNLWVVGLCLELAR